MNEHTAECGCVISVEVSIQGSGCCEQCWYDEAYVDNVRVVSHCAEHSAT
jgi:hypothetical protein